MILACGDVHKRVLQMSKNLHPLIYQKGFQSKDFLSILDFLYFGDANAYMHIYLPRGSRVLFRQDDYFYIKILRPVLFLTPPYLFRAFLVLHPLKLIFVT